MSIKKISARKSFVRPQDLKFTGYRRPDGRFGARNYVLIIPVDDLSNAAAEAVAHNIRGTMALPHPYGRLQFGDDLDLTFRTLAGQGRNPNCAAAIVIGIEPNWTNRIVKEIEKTGKPVAGFSIERSGDHKTIQAASRKAKEFVHYATELKREPFTVKQLTLSTKCGESDTTSGLASNPTIGRAFERLADAGATLIFGETTEVTGGEDLVMDLCANKTIAAQFKAAFDDYQNLIASQGVDLLGSQPTEGNIRGGLTTIEEKALGNIQKAGRCKVVDFLKPAQEPRKPGLSFMDSSSAAAEMVTLCAAAGSVVHYFTTGQGNVIGNPTIPVIKLCANPLTVETMAEHVDVDLTGLLRIEINLDQAADLALQMLERTINGRLTAAEVLRHNEFVLTKLYRSA
ncbi:MAG: UxaA family hydrolase [Chloroflexi bacterium]|nr:UxaA family hydrolase [Chloroflexota bacterium]